jgi:hypothetical protein
MDQIRCIQEVNVGGAHEAAVTSALAGNDMANPPGVASMTDS